MVADTDLSDEIEDLSVDELVHVFQHLVGVFGSDANPVVGDDAIAERFEADLAFLAQAATRLGIEGHSENQPTAHDVLQTIVDTLGETREEVARGIEQARARVTLPVDAGAVSLMILATAAAVAIIRPKIVRKEKRDLFSHSKETTFDVKGIQSVDALVRVLLDYVRNQSIGS